MNGTGVGPPRVGRLEDLSERETADLLGCSVGASEQLATRGLAGLRDRIGEDR